MAAWNLMRAKKYRSQCEGAAVSPISIAHAACHNHSRLSKTDSLDLHLNCSPRSSPCTLSSKTTRSAKLLLAASIFRAGWRVQASQYLENPIENQLSIFVVSIRQHLKHFGKETWSHRSECSIALPCGFLYGIDNIQENGSPPSSLPNKTSWDLNIQSAGTDWPEHMAEPPWECVFSRHARSYWCKHTMLHSGFLSDDPPWEFRIHFLTWAAGIRREVVTTDQTTVRNYPILSACLLLAGILSTWSEDIWGPCPPWYRSV